MISGTVYGHLGDDAELRFTNGGDPVLNFTIASNMYNGKEDVTTWVRCAMFGTRAEKVSKDFTKGKALVLRGELYLREWESKGEKGKSLEMRVENFVYAGSKGDGGRGGERSVDRRDERGESRAPQRDPRPRGRDERAPQRSSTRREREPEPRNRGDAYEPEPVPGEDDIPEAFQD